MKKLLFTVLLFLFAFAAVSCDEATNTQETCNHVWEEATCTTPKKCSACGTTSGSALAHDWSAATCTTPKKCTACGESEGAELGHEWENATCTNPKTCSRCNKIDGYALGHTEVTDKAVAATCTQAGKTEGKHCSACHTTLIAQTTIQPTGNHSGQYVCTGCNTSFFDMTKELLIKRGGSYSSNNYKITYNSSENRIEIVYTKTSNNTSRDKYTFLAYILENSSSLVWGYSHEYDKVGFSNGQYIYQGTAEEYMIGEIICSSVSTSTSTLDYTYNTFSTQYSYIYIMG